MGCLSLLIPSFCLLSSLGFQAPWAFFFVLFHFPVTFLFLSIPSLFLSRIFSFHFRLPSFSSRHSFPLPSLRSKKYLVIFGRFSFHVAQHFRWTFRPLFYYCVVFLFQLVLFSSRSRENGKMFVRFFFLIFVGEIRKKIWIRIFKKEINLIYFQTD